MTLCLRVLRKVMKSRIACTSVTATTLSVWVVVKAMVMTVEAMEI